MLPDVVELGDRGLRRGGEPWSPTGPFLAVIGDPVAHSLSPRLQNAGLDEREIAAEYVALRIAAGRLRELKSASWARELAGFNVTAPHKEAVAALCDRRTEQARDVGAVNTVKVEDGRWLGHNTDSGGLVAVLGQAWPQPAPPPEVHVLGAGGSARAAVDALDRWGAPAVVVHNRSAAGRERLARWLERRRPATTVRIERLTAERPAAPTGPTLWISCLAGGVPNDPFLPAAAGGHEALLVDLRYGDQLPDEQPPLGFRRIDGLPLLMMQGGLSFAWWFGPPVPWTAFQAALAATD